MIEIIPAIMPASYADLEEKSALVAGHVPLVQIDVMDGVFVPPRSWPYGSGGLTADPDFLALAKQDEILPRLEALDYEIDLMISHPEEHLSAWFPLGASRLIVHIEAIENLEAFFESEFFHDRRVDAREESIIAVGLAITPGTPVESLFPWIPVIDFVQVMGIAKIGYQGEPFDERAPGMINTLRAKFPNLPISVDGGVSLQNVKELIHAGATRLVAGSAIFGTEAPIASIALLEEEAAFLS